MGDKEPKCGKCGGSLDTSHGKRRDGEHCLRTHYPPAGGNPNPAVQPDKPKSNCCGEPVKTVVAPEGTRHFRCTGCSLPCDLKPSEPAVQPSGTAQSMNQPHYDPIADITGNLKISNPVEEDRELLLEAILHEFVTYFPWHPDDLKLYDYSRATNRAIAQLLKWKDTQVLEAREEELVNVTLNRLDRLAEIRQRLEGDR